VFQKFLFERPTVSSEAKAMPLQRTVDERRWSYGRAARGFPKLEGRDDLLANRLLPFSGKRF
jgi:hypothetical protein